MAFYENTIIAKQDLAEKDLNSIKDLEKTWIDTRNMIINKLYHEHNVSMIKIGNICGISRQMVHYICKGRKA